MNYFNIVFVVSKECLSVCVTMTTRCGAIF